MDIIFEYNLLTYFLFVFNLFCFFNSSLDWDTSNHLYEAKLRRNNHNFKSSYRLGIKIFVIKLYELFWDIINKQLKLFRIFSILSFLITFIYLNHLTPENSEKYLILLSYFFFISLYNPQTSATEFFSTLVILIVLNVFSSQSDLIFLGFFIILLNSILFKNIEILYVLPYIFLISNGKLNTIDKRFAMFVLKENNPGEPLILHDEPIYFEDKIIGRTTSGNYSFNFKKNLAFGYINNEYSQNTLLEGNLYIEIEKNKYSVELILKPLKQTNFKNN